MRLPRCFFVVGAALVFSGAKAIERLPLEDFTRQPDTLQGRLSPDGKHFAYQRDLRGKTRLNVLNLDSGLTYRIDPGPATLVNGAQKEVASLEWVSDRRLVVTTTVWDMFYGVAAMNLDGSRARAISGLEDGVIQISGPPRLWAREVVHRFYDEDQQILMLDRHEGGPGSWNRPDVLKVRTSDGLISVEVKNPGNVASWGVDHEGVVRLGILSHGDLSGAIYRESRKAPWRTILPLADRRETMRPVGFDAAKNQVFVAGLTENRRWTIFRLDPETGERGEALLSDPEYDILPERAVPTIDGMALAAPIFSRRGDTLLGVRYVTDAPRVKWFTPEFASYQKAVDRALPDTVNILVDLTLDGKRMLWFGYSDQNPGVYHLLDLEKKSFRPIASRMGWIKPEQMAPMLAVNYAARDGLVIRGFLTVPLGYEPKKLPLVVLPHGGPWVRDVWGFSWLVQLLANRGYAVLQMNYRGSPGYGDELYRAARRQIGRKIQDDIEDGARWAIAAGVADPARIAIVGGSYGGYSALFALGHDPELYRCGVSINGVTDWPEIFDDRKSDPDYKAANRHWRREIGDPEADGVFLREISPVNFADKIVAPVLILQGKQDKVVPQEQAKLMVAALEKAGRKPESAFIPRMGHQMSTPEARGAVASKLVEFLEKHLGPGME